MCPCVRRLTDLLLPAYYGTAAVRPVGPWYPHTLGTRARRVVCTHLPLNLDPTTHLHAARQSPVMPWPCYLLPATACLLRYRCCLLLPGRYRRAGAGALPRLMRHYKGAGRGGPIVEGRGGPIVEGRGGPIVEGREGPIVEGRGGPIVEGRECRLR